MSETKKSGLITTIVLTLLAWLGLAGVSDNWVEWQNWFEIGIMQHWRSVKEWLIAVVFDRMPFQVQPWMIDWVLVGSIVSRSFHTPMPSNPTGAELDWDLWLEWRIRQIFSRVFVVLFWPLYLFAMLVVTEKNRRELIRDGKLKPRQYDHEIYASTYSKWKLLLFWNFILFIPVLFVCSTWLYKFG